MKERTLIVLIFLCMAVSLLGYALFRNAGWQPVSAVPRPSDTEEAESLPPLAGGFQMTPVIDPGHGGVDGGAVSVTGVGESSLNLEISLKMEMLLRFLGLRPVLTRTSDMSLHDPSASSVRAKKNSDLKNRAALVNGVSNAVLISIHQNKFPLEQSSGAQVFHNGNASNRVFAEFMQERLRLYIDPDNNRQAKKTDIYLLNHVQCPAVLIECGFVSNYAEEALLRDSVYQTKFALSVCGGLLEWGRTPG